MIDELDYLKNKKEKLNKERKDIDNKIEQEKESRRRERERKKAEKEREKNRPPQPVQPSPDNDPAYNAFIRDTINLKECSFEELRKQLEQFDFTENIEELKKLLEEVDTAN